MAEAGTEASWFDEEAFGKLKRTVKTSVFRRLLELFLENTKARVEEVGSTDQAADPDTVAFALHSLKGSALMVGARELEVAAESMRTAVRGGENDVFEARLERLRAARSRVEERLRRELRQLDAD